MTDDGRETPEDTPHPEGMPPKGEAKTAWEDQGSIVERLRSPKRGRSSQSEDSGEQPRTGAAEPAAGHAGDRLSGTPAEAAHRVEAGERAADMEERLSGRTGRQVRRDLARATAARQSEERFGEIEAAQQLVLDRPHPEPISSADEDERRGANHVGFWFLLSAACTIAFLVIYVLSDAHEHLRRQNLLFGLTLGLALLFIGVGAVVWVKRVMPHEDAVQLREELHSSADDVRSLELDWAKGVEDSAVTRRKILLGTLGVSTGLLAIPPLFLLRDLGPSPTGAGGRSVFTYTAWRRNMRFVDYDTNLPVKVDEIGVGSLLTVVPEGHYDAAADSSVMLIRLAPETVKMSYFDDYAKRFPQGNFKGTDFVIDGFVAYSKICTHAGCPVSLYQRQVEQFLCPCHQSTFVANEAGKVIFGPAARALPMLPFYVDGQGYFRSLGDFPEPVGPSFWERG